MKKFYFALMALFCATALFTGCSDDDDDEKGNGQGSGNGSGVEILSKKIVKIISHNETESEKFITLFQYDANNRLSKMTEIEEDGTEKEVTDIIYEDNKITITTTSTENKSVIQLRDGKAVSYIEYWEGDRIDFVYNYSGKYLSNYTAKYFRERNSWREEGVANVVYTVKDANLEEMSYVYTSHYDEDANEKVSNKFELGVLDNNTNLNLYSFILDDNTFLFDVVGDRFKKLPVKIISTDEGKEDITTYTYEVDKDGYITKIIEKMDNEDGYTFEITYE